MVCEGEVRLVVGVRVVGVQRGEFLQLQCGVLGDRGSRGPREAVVSVTRFNGRLYRKVGGVKDT